MSKDINTEKLVQSTENLGKKMPDNDKKIASPKKGSKKNTVIINPVLSNKPNDEPVTYDVLDNPINESKALTALQRIHRGQVLRRIAPRLKRAREQAQHRIAGEGKLSERAMRHARNIIRDRLIGSAGVKYAEMDYASKQRIDKMLETKVAAIKRLALRLVPNERRTEQQRHSNFTHKDMADHNVHKKAEVVAEAYDRLDGAADPKGTSRYKQELIAGKNGKERLVNRAVNIKSVEEGLIKKSETTGIPLEALEEVYVRGLNTYNSTKYPSLTREQYAYGRVNKFVAESNSIDDDIKSRFRSNLRKDS